MHIDLPYGRTSIGFEYDESRFSLLKAPGLEGERPLSDAEIGAAIDAPIASPPLGDIISPGDSVLIVVSDATRQCGTPQITNLLVRRLIEYGVAPFDIRIIFATGIHRAVSDEEKRSLLTPFIAQRITTLSHDAYDPGSLVNLGMTPRGTPVEVNRALRDHDKIILTGGVGFHYFAGFTGGRKSICPGLASAATVEATHVLALDFEKGGRRAGIASGNLEGNAVHEECERIAAEVAPSFLINSIVDERGRVVKVYTGDWRAAHRVACEEYARSHSVSVESTREVLIVSCGGAPYDINLIQAHKALEQSSHACTEGGTIILVAKCEDGLGRDDFLKWFESENSRALEKRLFQNYEVNGQTAWSLLNKNERFQVFLVSDLDDEAVRKMRMIPVKSIDVALSQTSDSAKGYIAPRGASILPVV